VRGKDADISEKVRTGAPKEMVSSSLKLSHELRLSRRLSVVGGFSLLSGSAGSDGNEPAVGASLHTNPHMSVCVKLVTEHRHSHLSVCSLADFGGAAVSADSAGDADVAVPGG